MKAAKPLGRAIAAKGLKAAKNPRNRRRLMLMAATVGRITGDPQLARLAEHQIKKAAVKTERHLMSGKRINRKSVKKLIERM